MKGLSNVLVGLGILVLVYSILGRFVGASTLGLGIMQLSSTAGITFANALLLLGILTKLNK